MKPEDKLVKNLQEIFDIYYRRALGEKIKRGIAEAKKRKLIEAKTMKVEK